MGIKKDDIEMRVIDYQTARNVITENHYSHTMPCCELALGFYIDNVLNCVIVFGQSATSKMAKSLPSEKYWELSRLFSFDWGGKYIESYCIGKALKYVEKTCDKDLIVSFADPSQAHVGGIYQATNWLYCGLTSLTGGYTYFFNDKWQHPRSTVAKYGTRKHDSILAIDPTVKYKRIPRKHRYIYLLGSRKQRQNLLKRLKYPVLPYPKKETPEEVSRVIRSAPSREGRVQSPHSAFNVGGSIKGDTLCSQQRGAGSIPALRFDEIMKIIRATNIFPKILANTLPEGEKVPMKQNKPKHGKPVKMIPALAQEDVAFQLLLAHSNERVRNLCKAKAACTSWPLHQAKVEGMIRQAACADGWVHAPLKYCGAHTGRWSGMEGINLLNMGGKGRGKPIHPLIAKIRNAILPPEGYKFIIVDSAQIEARELAWISGQNDLVEDFRTGGDPYSRLAMKVFGGKVWKPTTEEKKTPEGQTADIRRGFGKDTILGAGFGLGSNTFFDRCRQNETLRPMFDSGEYTWDFIDKLIKTYRSDYPRIPAFWRSMEKCFRWVTKYPNEVMTYFIPDDRVCLHEGMDKVKPIIKNAILTFWKEGSTTIIQLPSGRRLFYRYAAVNPKDKSLKYIWGLLWGGTLTENVIQAICRDLLAGWLLKCERQGIHIVLHSYDELVGCVEEDKAEWALAEMKRIMMTGPDWAAGLPLDAEGEIAGCYKK